MASEIFDLEDIVRSSKPVSPPLAVASRDEFRESRTIPLAEEIRSVREHVDKLEANEIVRFALSRYRDRITVISSFGSESAILLHIAAEIDPTVPVLFLNTGKLFGETLRYRDRLQETLGLTDVRAVGPHPEDILRSDKEGTLWNRNPNACCHIRKVLPLRRALKGFDAQINGRKRFQTTQRANLGKVEIIDGRICFNPLADWTSADLEAYRERCRLPKHPLADDGYMSIGCMPCTQRVAAGSGYRSGRWHGLGKDECGIHTGVDGEGI